MVELRLIADRAIEQPGVEHRQPEMRRQRARDRALARCGRPVDGNDHRCNPSSSGSKLGKLVAPGAMSSISTGAVLTSPATAKLMPLRWSRWPAMVDTPASAWPAVPSMKVGKRRGRDKRCPT